MYSLGTLLLTVFITLLPITNPLGNAAIFLSITEGDTPEERRAQALRGAFYMFLLLSGFFLAGSYIMAFFGITLEGIRIAGGLVITKIGFNLLAPKVEHTHSADEHHEAQGKEDIAFSPLAMPLLAGPGSIAAIMGVAASLPRHDGAHYATVILGIFLACAACWLILRESDRLLKCLGVNGANALTKIMGFLLLCIGVQLVINGAMALYPAA